MKKNGIIKYCKTCNKEIYIPQYLLKIKKFCSKKCKDINQLGKPFFLKTQFKKGELHGIPFRKGNIPWDKGIKRIDISGENHPFWKGDDVGYNALHAWIRKQLGAPNICEHCKTTCAKKYEWANKSREYKRDIEDWIRLCVSCHRIYDNSLEKAWITRKIKYG